MEEIWLMCAGITIVWCSSRGVLKLELKLISSLTNLRKILEGQMCPGVILRFKMFSFITHFRADLQVTLFLK